MTKQEIEELRKLYDRCSLDWCEDPEGAPPVHIVSGDPMNPEARVVAMFESFDDGVLAVQMHAALPALLAIAESARWRETSKEPPTEDGVYEVSTGDFNSNEHLKRGKWESGQTWKFWRPRSLPQRESKQ